VDTSKGQSIPSRQNRSRKASTGPVHASPAREPRYPRLQLCRSRGGRLLTLTRVTEVTRLHPVSGVVAAASRFAVSPADRQGATRQPVVAEDSGADAVARSIQGWKKQQEFAAKAQEQGDKDRGHWWKVSWWLCVQIKGRQIQTHIWSWHRRLLRGDTGTDSPPEAVYRRQDCTGSVKLKCSRSALVVWKVIVPSLWLNP